MKTATVLLEVHFYRDSDGQYWSQRVVDYHFLTRYLDAFDEINVVARVSYKENVTSMMRVSGPCVHIFELPDTHGLKETVKQLSKFRKIFKKSLMKSNAAILRAPSILTFFLVDVVMRAKKPFVVDFGMSADRMIPQKGLVSVICNKLIDYRFKKICLRADGVSYVTKEILQKSYPCQAIKHPKDKKYFTNHFSSLQLSERDYFSQNWVLDKKPKIFTLSHTGFMDDGRKCQDIVIKAVALVSKRGYSVRLKFIGDGPQRGKLEKLAKDVGISSICTFLGMIRSRDELFGELRESHLFVLPTKAEGLPRAVLEAMAQGLPCISSPVDGVPELLPEEDLADWHDVKAFAQLIIDEITNWQRMVRESERNYNEAKLYSDEILQARRSSFYSLLAKKV